MAQRMRDDLEVEFNFGKRLDLCKNFHIKIFHTGYVLIQ